MVNHALFSSLFSLTNDDELQQKLIIQQAATLPHRKTSAVQETGRQRTLAPLGTPWLLMQR